MARQRQELPWVRSKRIRFETWSGENSAELFHGRSQLLIYHLMFGPDYEAGCPSCSMIADGFNGFWEAPCAPRRDAVAVSRAPFDKLQAYKDRMGWSFPWASSSGATSTRFRWPDGGAAGAGYDYNFESKPPLLRDVQGAPQGQAAMCGVDLRTYLKEMPGMSAFVKEEGEIFHTYSTYGRGLDSLWGAYQWLDRAPLGRNELAGHGGHRDRYAAL